MPRFYFNIHNGDGLTEDEEGRDLPDAAAARDEAVKGVRSLAAEEVKGGRLDLSGRIAVTDESGALLFNLPFADAVAIAPTPAPFPPPLRKPAAGVSEAGAIIARRLRQLGDLDDEDVAVLHGIEAQVRDVARGEDLLLEGTRPTTSIVVISGMLQRHNLSGDGRRQIHSFYIATDTPSLETIHIDYMDNVLAAAARSRVGIVSHAELHRVMEERPRLRALIWRETLVQASVFRAWLLRNSRLLAHAQLAHFFCEMLTRGRAAGIADGNEMELPLTQEDIADALGMTAVHVNRTLALLRTGGLVDFRGGRLIVRNWNALSDTAEFDARYLHLRAAAPAAR